MVQRPVLVAPLSCVGPGTGSGAAVLGRRIGSDPIGDYLAVCRTMTAYLHVGMRVGARSLSGRVIPAAIVGLEGLEAAGRRKTASQAPWRDVQPDAVSSKRSGPPAGLPVHIELDRLDHVVVPAAQEGHPLRRFWFNQMRALAQVPGLITTKNGSSPLSDGASASTSESWRGRSGPTRSSKEVLEAVAAVLG